LLKYSQQNKIDPHSQSTIHPVEQHGIFSFRLRAMRAIDTYLKAIYQLSIDFSRTNTSE